MFVIVDFDINNSGSLSNMVNRVGYHAYISSEPSDLRQAKGIFLPGNGTFDVGMHAIKQNGLLQNIEECVFTRKIPILGICLGMQLLAKQSEEGVSSGLGWLDANVVKLNSNGKSKVPHMGWNEVKTQRPNELLAADSYQKFYFVHSYHMVCNDPNDVTLSTNHGTTITVGIQRDNIFGVQFHPEKSHSYGAELIKNFCDYCNAI